MTEYIKIYMYEHQFRARTYSTSKLTLFEDFDADSGGGVGGAGILSGKIGLSKLWECIL